MFDPAAKRLAGLQVTQVLRGDVDDVVERGGQVEPGPRYAAYRAC